MQTKSISNNNLICSLVCASLIASSTFTGGRWYTQYLMSSLDKPGFIGLGRFIATSQSRPQLLPWQDHTKCLETNRLDRSLGEIFKIHGSGLRDNKQSNNLIIGVWEQRVLTWASYTASICLHVDVAWDLFQEDSHQLGTHASYPSSTQQKYGTAVRLDFQRLSHIIYIYIYALILQLPHFLRVISRFDIYVCVCLVVCSSM